GRAGQDRHLPGTRGAEGAVGRDVLLQPGQPERGAPAPRARAEGVSAQPRRAGGAVAAGRGEPVRGQGRRGARPLASAGGRVALPGLRPPRGRAAPGSEVTAMHDVVDLRSDTLTLPTPEMREAMAHAAVGDDVWEEDPTVRRLESLAAERLGKEAGLFVTSGTQGNLVSVLAQTRSGQEILLDEDSHVFNYEGAGAALIGGVQTHPLRTPRGFPTPDQVAAGIRPSNIHIPTTGLVCLENTHNRRGGTCCAPEEIEAVAPTPPDARGPVPPHPP